MSKKYMKKIYLANFIILFFIISSISFTIAQTNVQNLTNSEHIESNSSSELSIIYSPDGKGYKQEIIPGKYLMHLEGSPYEMGYQQGYLGATSVIGLANDDWFKHVMTELVDADDLIMYILLLEIMNYNRLKDVVGDVVDDWTLRQLSAKWYNSVNVLLDKLIDLCLIIVQINSQYVPLEFLEEIQGVADGCADAGYPITYEDVLLLNMGMDAMLALAYPVIEPLLLLMDLFSFLSCSGFIAQEDATTSGQTIMGHHWQFTDYVLHEEMLIMEYFPNTGNKFMSTSCPGFVGGTAMMNDQGIAISQDMVPACDCDPGTFGLGTLLTVRYVAQHTSQLSEAISYINDNERGCPWIYTIGDGRNGETGGVMLETSEHYCNIRGLDYSLPWYAFGYSQIEGKDDLVTCTNHYIYYDMNYWADSTAITDSKDRYTWLTNEALNVYGLIDLEVGAELIDYLHPPNYDYYDDPNGPIGASITCWDLTNLQAKVLYGHYNDEWVYVSL